MPGSSGFVAVAGECLRIRIVYLDCKIRLWHPFRISAPFSLLLALELLQTALSNICFVFGSSVIAPVSDPSSTSASHRLALATDAHERIRTLLHRPTDETTYRHSFCSH